VTGDSQRTRLVIKVTIKTKAEERRVKALIDLGAKANCIKQRLALKMDILVLPGEPTPLMSLEGAIIYLYRDYGVSIAVTDT
jgi:hypothetical protein